MPLPLPIGLLLAATAASFALSFTAALRGADALAGRVAFLARARTVAPGALVGVAAWAQDVDGAGFSAALRLDPAAVLASLAIAVGGSTLSFAVFRRAKGALRIIAAGAIVGAAIACAEAALLAGSGADVDLGDAPFASGVAVASALAVAAFAVFSRRRGLRGRIGAALFLAMAVGVCPLLAIAGPDVAPAAAGLAATQLAPVATQAMAVLVVAAYALERRPQVRPSTTAQAGRGSQPLSQARRQAGTAFPRPRPARSVAAPAGAPGRRDRKAR